MNQCQGKTIKNKPCTNKVTKPNQYCRFHLKNKVATTSTTLVSQEINIKTTDCSICLEEVDNENDCYLQCGHAHHIQCINQLKKLECPRCRGPMVFIKPSAVNLYKIKQQEKQAKEKQIQEEQDEIRKNEQQEQEEASRRLVNTLTLTNTAGISKEDQLLQKVLADSLLSAEIDEKKRIYDVMRMSYDEFTSML